jgi:hypothetical protein
MVDEVLLGLRQNWYKLQSRLGVVVLLTNEKGELVCSTCFTHRWLIEQTKEVKLFLGTAGFSWQKAWNSAVVVADSLAKHSSLKSSLVAPYGQ